MSGVTCKLIVSVGPPFTLTARSHNYAPKWLSKEGPCVSKAGWISLTGRDCCCVNSFKTKVKSNMFCRVRTSCCRAGLCYSGARLYTKRWQSRLSMVAFCVQVALMLINHEFCESCFTSPWIYPCLFIEVYCFSSDTTVQPNFQTAV